MNGLGGLTSFMAREGIDDFGHGLGEFLHRAKNYHFLRTQQHDGMDRYIKRKIALKGRWFNTILNGKTITKDVKLGEQVGNESHTRK